jgi:hypothetical protein
VLALVAGRAGTDVLLGWSTDSGSEIDDQQAIQWLMADGRRSEWQAELARRSLLIDCRMLVSQYRAEIEAVAKALLERENLSGAEIDELMRAAH